ncbi:MAG TPA: tetratricopeptide repeat protein [Methanosarcinales archaeon]|nr:tetratricopeptide repeat protein [Methanosarcinales archaeon]
MKVFQIPLLKNFQINPALLEKPQTLPFDMPADKKEKIITLLLWGMNAYHPDFLALDYKEIESVAGNRNVELIKGIKVDKSTLLTISVRSENELRSALKAGRRIPSLMIVIDILDPEVPASRRWLFQLKNEAVDAIRKTIYEDKRIDETLLEGGAFDFALKNFEDPIDTVEFLDLVISTRSEDKEMEETINEAFIAMVSDKMSVLKANQVKTLLSLVVTDSVPDIRRLTALSEEAISKAIDELQIQGLVHRRGETTVLPLYLNNLKKPGLLIGVVERMAGKMERGRFDEIEEFYFGILKEIKPKGEMIEPPMMRAETMRAISYPFPEMEELDTLVISLKAQFMGEVAKEIENPDRLIEIVDEVLFKTIDDQIRGIALSVRALAYMKKGSLEESRRDIDEAYKSNPEVLNLLVPFYLSYGNLYRERAKYKESVECYDRALKLAEGSGDTLRVAQALIGIAEVRLGQANYKEAEELVKDGMKIAEGLEESGRSMVAQALDLLGNIRYASGNARQAIEYFERALSIDRVVCGEIHPAVARDLSNIGTVHDLGEHTKAIKYYEQALSIDREVYGEKHPAVARDLNNIGMAWHRLGDPRKAIEYFKQALLIDRGVYGKRHPAVATYLDNIGLAWHDLNKPRKAIEYYEQALTIDREAYGDEHPDVARDLNNIGGSWKVLGEPRKAIEYYEQALSIDRAIYGERHPDVATRLNNIGTAWHAFGDRERAKTYLQQAYSIFQEVYGDEHPNTRNVKRGLDVLKG